MAIFIAYEYSLHTFISFDTLFIQFHKYLLLLLFLGRQKVQVPYIIHIVQPEDNKGWNF